MTNTDKNEKHFSVVSHFELFFFWQMLIPTSYAIG